MPSNGSGRATVINGQTILALSACPVASRYVDTVHPAEELTEDELRAVNAAHPHQWLVLVRGSPECVDACLERAQLGHGCVSTTLYRPNGAICVASAEWLADHDFSHAGLAKYEMEPQ